MTVRGHEGACWGAASILDLDLLNRFDLTDLLNSSNCTLKFVHFTKYIASQ